jgi:hypothetical protein
MVNRHINRRRQNLGLERERKFSIIILGRLNNSRGRDKIRDKQGAKLFKEREVKCWINCRNKESLIVIRN